MAAAPEPEPPRSQAPIVPSVAPSPAPRAPAPAVPARAAPVAAPVRYDADYLRNPPPAYPSLSRRLHEEGRVVLLVRVTAEGAAASVSIERSSGHARLDEAALDAVRRWRFVPARRGDEAVAASVLVPLVFRLDG